ncbi:MAG: periplasmic heavy metal sensor [Ferruginibacter sp.]
MMNTKPGTKFLIMLVALLAIANIILLGIMFSRKPHTGFDRGNRREEQMKSFLQKELGFSPAQMQAYDSSSSTHRQSMRQLFDEMKQYKENNLRSLGNSSFTDSAIEATAFKAGEQQKLIEQKMLRHLQEVRNICTAEQRAKFDTNIHKLFSKKDRNKPDKK